MAVWPAFTVAEVELPAAAPKDKSSGAFMVSVRAVKVLPREVCVARILCRDRMCPCGQRRSAKRPLHVRTQRACSDLRASIEERHYARWCDADGARDRGRKRNLLARGYRGGRSGQRRRSCRLLDSLTYSL